MGKCGVICNLKFSASYSAMAISLAFFNNLPERNWLLLCAAEVENAFSIFGHLAKSQTIMQQAKQLIHQT